jgi:hypothetical protein
MGGPKKPDTDTVGFYAAWLTGMAIGQLSIYLLRNPIPKALNEDDGDRTRPQYSVRPLA